MHFVCSENQCCTSLRITHLTGCRKPSPGDWKEYACNVEVLKGIIKAEEESSEEENARCADLSIIVGTLRW